MPTKVDGAGNLLSFQGSSVWGYCESTCPTDTDSSDTIACQHSEPPFPEECAARHASTHKNVLFLGNSYTGGCSGIDGVVRKIAEGAGFSATTERSSPGGKTLNWHAHNSLNKIKNGDWDAVVLQDQLTQAYNTMAYVSQPAKVAPAGEAWRTFANRNSLFANDGSHATCSGTFLAACTIFQQIWGVPCSASTYSPVGDAAALKEQADAIVAAGADAGTAAEPWSWPNNGPPCPGCINMAGR